MQGDPRSRPGVAAGLLLVLLASGVLAGCGGDDNGKAGLRTFPAARATKGARIAVELALTARSVSWEPGVGDREGRLVLEGIAPRMSMVAAAPSDKAATVPSSFLAAHWKSLFGKQQLATNAILALPQDGDRGRMVSLRIELTDAVVSGRRFSFDVEPLKDAALKSPALGNSKANFGAPTLLVDPTVTDADKNLWAKLKAFFSGDKTVRVPDVPIYRGAQRGWVFDNGANDPTGEGEYAGPLGGEINTDDEWRSTERSIFDQAGGSWRDAKVGGNLSPEFTGNAYRGLALFAPSDLGRRFGSVDFAPARGNVRVERSAFYLMQTDTLNIGNAEFGGVNMRGLNAETVHITNSVFDRVDMTAAVWGSEDAPTRSTVQNSAFLNVTSDALAHDPDGSLDVPSTHDLDLAAVDFVSTTFQDSSFKQGRFAGVTFQGCGFQNVDFRGTKFTGKAPTAKDPTLDKTFDNSILDRVSFDGATLENVSFAGVDFSSGKVSFDGTTFKNVDFTGAVGLQNVDFSNVEIAGRVWGLAPYRAELPEGTNHALIRSVTFDGVVPAIDAQTGFDVEPSGKLVDPATGVRLERSGGQLRPIDPRTGRPLTDPDNSRQDLRWTGDRLENPNNPSERFNVDFLTGELIR